MALDEFAPDLSRASLVGRLALDLWMTPLSPSDLPRPQGKDLCCLYLLDYPSQDFLNGVQLSSFASPYPHVLLCKKHDGIFKRGPS
jgi:hypothetical protein